MHNLPPQHGQPQPTCPGGLFILRGSERIRAGLARTKAQGTRLASARERLKGIAHHTVAGVARRLNKSMQPIRPSTFCRQRT